MGAVEGRDAVVGAGCQRDGRCVDEVMVRRAGRDLLDRQGVADLVDQVLSGSAGICWDEEAVRVEPFAYLLTADLKERVGPLP